MRKILVTGGAGFIGANFVHYWANKYPEDHITVLDALTYAGNYHNLKPLLDRPNFTFVKGNITDESLVTRLLREAREGDTHTKAREGTNGTPTRGTHGTSTRDKQEEAVHILVHFAAESHVDRSIVGPDAFVDTNILGTYALLKAAKTVWLDEAKGRPHHFHHVSTDEVYGSLGACDPAFAETTPYAPNSPYAASKAASDHLVRAYHHTYGLRVTTSNCSNNYGPYHFPEKLIPLCLLNILAGKPLPIYGDGRQIRDWLYVDDHNRGIDLVINRGHPGQTYNIGGNNEWANIDVVRLLCQLLDQRFTARPVLTERFPDSPCARGVEAASLITFVQDRPGHDTRYAIDAGKITAELGYRPVVDFMEGLARTVEWYLDNEPWWRAIQDGSYREVLDRMG